MSSFFYKPSLFKHKNLVAVFNRRKSVRNKEHGVIFSFADNAVEKFVFGNRVQGARRFIKNLHRGIFYKSAGNGNFLTFTAGQDTAVFIKFLCHYRINSFVQLLNALKDSGFFQGLFYELILVFIMASHKNIFFYRHSKKFEVLEGGGKNIPVGLEVVKLDVLAVIKDCA